MLVKNALEVFEPPVPPHPAQAGGTTCPRPPRPINNGPPPYVPPLGGGSGNGPCAGGVGCIWLPDFCGASTLGSPQVCAYICHCTEQ